MAAGASLTILLVIPIFWLTRGNQGPVGNQPAAEATTVSAAPLGAGAPPDISSLSPRERFDRLYNRIMKSAESGDQNGVEQFTPMALMAYQQLDTIDADARFHAALLKLHTGDVAGAKALGDTVLRQTPGHLFGYIILGTAARWAKDDAGHHFTDDRRLAHFEKEHANQSRNDDDSDHL